MDHVTAYQDTRRRIVDLLAEDPDAPVPATPGWTVRDVVAHLTGLAADLVVVGGALVVAGVAVVAGAVLVAVVDIARTEVGVGAGSAVPTARPGKKALTAMAAPVSAAAM